MYADVRLSHRTIVEAQHGSHPLREFFRDHDRTGTAAVITEPGAEVMKLDTESLLDVFGGSR